MVDEDLESRLIEKIKKRVDEVKRKKEEEKNAKDRHLKALELRRKELMDFLKGLYHKELCQNYLQLEGSLEVCRFSSVTRLGFFNHGFYRHKIIFKRDGIYLNEMPFDDGKATENIDCGMISGYHKKNYDLAEMVIDKSDFKERVSKNFYNKLKEKVGE